jgi:predicted HTH transcriptional regulator
LTLDDPKLESLGLLVPFAGRLFPSIGGLILFGKAEPLSRYCPDARFSCARFRGIDKAEFIDRLDIDGTVLDALIEAPKFHPTQYPHGSKDRDHGPT